MAKKTLMNDSGLPATEVVESNPGAGLPVGFSGDDAAIQVGERLYQTTPYVTFISSRSQNFGKVSQYVPDLSEGDPVLIRPEPDRPAKLSPFTFFLVRAKQHFAKVDMQGAILACTTDQQRAKELSKGGDKFLEHIETVLLVKVGNGLVCARCTFKTTKTNCAHKAIDTLTSAKDAEYWGSLSPDHKMTLSIPTAFAWARFTCTAKLKSGTGKGSGLAYVAADGIVKPSTVADWKSIGEYFSEQANRDSAEQVIEQYDKRIQDVLSKGV